MMVNTIVPWLVCKHLTINHNDILNSVAYQRAGDGNQHAE